jgi:hypothetical protein
MIVLIPRWYATWSLKKWQWKREVSCNLGAGGVVKSGVWSLECGVWSVEECGERDGDDIFIYRGPPQRVPQVSNEAFSELFCRFDILPIAPTANFAPIQLPISGPSPLDAPRLDLVTWMLLYRWLVSVAQGNPGCTTEGLGISFYALEWR